MSATAQRFGLAGTAYYIMVTYFAPVKHLMLVLYVNWLFWTLGQIYYMLAPAQILIWH